MLLRFKLRLGALVLLVGASLAAVGELFTLWNTNPLTGGWFVSMGLIVFGTLALLYGITTYAQLSEEITLLGLGGTGLLALGGFVLILGTIVLNMVVVPLLLGMAATITTVLNAPGSVVQSATNSAISGLNKVSSFFGSSSSIPSVQIPQADGIQIISNTLTGLHLPTVAVLSQWGHVFASGGPLAVGCLLLGFALLQAQFFPKTTCYVLMAAGGLNLVSQFFASIFPVVTTLIGVLLFAALVWLGISILSPEATGKFSSIVSFLPKGKSAQESVSTERDE